MNTTLTFQKSWIPALLCLLVLLPAAAQTVPTGPLAITVEEAVEIALVSNYTLRAGELDVRNASAQVREAWGSVYPHLDVSSSYTRNIRSPNPFAGSEAGGLFGSLGFVDWLAYNERARTDGDDGTSPMPFDEFQRRQREGLEAVGFTPGGDNPFAVPNQFQSSITLSQTIYNNTAFSAIRGARTFQDVQRQGLQRQQQLIADQVRQAYYQALLARRQAGVTGQSVTRTERTLQEVSRMVSTGVAPKSQRLGAEVQLANLETQYVQVRNQAEAAVDHLKLLLGIPADAELRLVSSLEIDDQARLINISSEDMVTLALANRPDLDQARMVVEINRIDRSMARSGYLPTITAFASAGYSGSVPDNRSSFLSDPNDPFAYQAVERTFFSSSYWNPGVNAGLRMSWQIFDGFQTSARIQQRQIAVDQAQVAYDQLEHQVRIEVERALRDLRAAEARLTSQQHNVGLAELNFEYAEARLREGVSSPFEVREASDQLDQSHLYYLQAVHDYARARSALKTAVGAPLPSPSPLRMTQTLPE
jgi:outer membrane protein TolC